MIKIYGMHTCPDCVFLEPQIKGDPNYLLIDIGEHVKNLKEFLHLRDSDNPWFQKVRERGTVGIPCFVLEDGTITFRAKEAGLIGRSDAEKDPLLKAELQARLAAKASDNPDGSHGAGAAEKEAGAAEPTASASEETPIVEGAACRLDGTGC